ncbi:Ig-like domain-containing protein [Cyclobacterium xiamenense]|uniref:Ig-like domain-containing protein n=1 Tax=Cyclobacterium xiamenense TaxID=1297121 RepID=UPI0035CF09EC
MTKLLRYLLGCSILLISACAKQSSPMGGPKDEDPPVLIGSNPTNQSTEVKPEEISLDFDEYITLETPNQSIIITPRIETEKVEFLANKNRVTITLNQELEDTTTYLFNFQTSIQDITEKNPAERLKLVFSTGPTIDSLQLSGTVDFVQPFDKPNFEDVLIGLYRETDTTDLFTAPPYYITQADSAGGFVITNIKAGKFKAYAWYDDNNSLKAEYRNEAYGFLTDPVDINTNVTDLHINLAKANLSELKISRSSGTGTNYDVVLSKPIVDFQIDHPDKNESLFYRQQDNSIRLYHRNLQNDSTQIRLQLQDSVGNRVDTLLYANFQESQRNKEKLTVTSNATNEFIDEINAMLTFNKPLYQIQYDSLFFSYDSAGRIPITPEMLSFSDSTHLRTRLQLNYRVPDTLTIAKLTLNASDSTFQDIENQWNEETIKTTFSRLKTDNLADGISGVVATNERPLLVQLLNTSDEPVLEQYLTDTNYFSFTNIEATTYKIQVIVDQNQNKRWDPGNYRLLRQPEPIYYFYDAEEQTDELIVRGGWTLEDLIIEPRRKSGFPANTEESIRETQSIRLPLEILILEEEDLMN